MQTATVQIPASVTSRRLRGQSRSFWLSLGAIMLVGLVIRCLMHQDRAWQGDEWGTILALKESYHHLLTHFGSWQTMNFYLAGLKGLSALPGDTNWILVAPGIVAGVWLVVLAAAIGLRLGGGMTALCAALLVATNPFLVTYSITIRSYIFLAAFSSAMLLCYLDWREHGRWRDGVLTGLCGGLALIFHLNATYTLAAIGVLALGWMMSSWRANPRGTLVRRMRLVVPCAVLVGLAAACYLPQMPDIAQFRGKWSHIPPTSLFFVPEVMARFFGSGWWAMPAVGMMLFAAWRSLRHRRPTEMLIVVIVVPVAAICVTGVSHYPHAYARFLVAVLPWMLILLADGLTIGSRSAAFGLLCLLMVGNAQGLMAQDRWFDGRPWHRVAVYIQDHAAGDARCVLIGPGVQGTALSVYGLEPSVSIVDVLKGRADDAAVELVLVDTQAVLPASAALGQLGEVRVVMVRGSVGEVAGKAVELLHEAAGGQVDARLAAVYAQLRELKRWQGDEAAAQHYTLLYEQSRALDHRVRNTPPQMR